MRAAESAEAEIVSADLAAESALAHLQEVDRARDRCARRGLEHELPPQLRGACGDRLPRPVLEERIRAVAAHEAALADLRGD